MQRTALILTALVVALLALEPAIANSNDYQQNDERILCAFIGGIEELVLNTTNRALHATCNVCRRLLAEMPVQLQEASSGMLQDYVQQVNEALASDDSYIEKRRLLQRFRHISRQIEQWRLQMEPERPAFQFDLISEGFYNDGRNRTEFDHLYLQFMQQFQNASQQLQKRIEHKVESLDILEEIASEENLRKKDKLYDEFIEMFLFKGNSKGNSTCYAGFCCGSSVSGTEQQIEMV